MSQVISLEAARVLKNTENEEHAYHARILSMDKLALVEEMVRFQEERTATGVLSAKMMICGTHLFKALEMNSETLELRVLARSYRRHLELEMAEMRKARLS